MAQKPKKLLDQVRDAVRLKHYAYRTEQSYVDWVRRNIPITIRPIPKIWEKMKLKNFLPISPLKGKYPHLHRINSSAPWFFYVAMFYIKNSTFQLDSSLPSVQPTFLPYRRQQKRTTFFSMLKILLAWLSSCFMAVVCGYKNAPDYGWRIWKSIENKSTLPGSWEFMLVFSTTWIIVRSLGQQGSPGSRGQ